MNQRNNSLRSGITSTVGIVAASLSFGAHATLGDGIVDIWNVNVDSVFNPASIVDSGGGTGPGVRPTGVEISNGNKTLDWGDGGPSGLDISNSPANANVNTNGPSVANVSITHRNQPITGVTLREVNLDSTLTLTPISPGAPGLPPAVFTFKIHYLETPNGANPCADGGANGVGVNINGCADIYVTDANSLNFPFFYDLDGAGPLQNQQYFISFFEQSAGLNPLPAVACAAVGQPAPCLGFRTPEEQNTTVTFASLITTQKISIPEPGTMALFATGLLGASFLRRRRS